MPAVCLCATVATRLISVVSRLRGQWELGWKGKQVLRANHATCPAGGIAAGGTNCGTALNAHGGKDMVNMPSCCTGRCVAACMACWADAAANRGGWSRGLTTWVDDVGRRVVVHGGQVMHVDRVVGCDHDGANHARHLKATGTRAAEVGFGSCVAGSGGSQGPCQRMDTKSVAELQTVQQHACPSSACENHLSWSSGCELETALHWRPGGSREAPVCS